MTDIFQLSPKAADYRARLERFMAEHIYPNEAALFETAETQADRWEALALLEELKAKAKAEGLWNLFLPDSELGAGLTNLDYAQRGAEGALAEAASGRRDPLRLCDD